MKTIMIVDDAKTVRIYHKAIISTDNRHVLEAENGIEALEKAWVNPSIYSCWMSTCQKWMATDCAES